jgi:hypothetical protein
VITTVANIAALRALSSPPSSAPASVMVLGYFNPGDPGAGLFVLNASDTTSPDNGGTIIVDAYPNRWY